MRVRAVEAGDLDVWIAMRRGLWPDEDADELASEAAEFIRNGRAFTLDAVLVSEDAHGRLTGFVEIGVRDYAEGCTSSPVAYVEGWYVVPESRRKGVGGALIEAVEAWSAARGYAELASDALLDNIVSEKAHKALGFEEVERAIHFRKALPRG
jgi:aminoglycoside 6'-N-acetyltransferase I